MAECDEHSVLHACAIQLEGRAFDQELRSGIRAPPRISVGKRANTAWGNLYQTVQHCTHSSQVQAATGTHVRAIDKHTGPQEGAFFKTPKLLQRHALIAERNHKRRWGAAKRGCTLPHAHLQERFSPFSKQSHGSRASWRIWRTLLSSQGSHVLTLYIPIHVPSRTKITFRT